MTYHVQFHIDNYDVSKISADGKPALTPDDWIDDRYFNDIDKARKYCDEEIYGKNGERSAVRVFKDSHIVSHIYGAVIDDDYFIDYSTLRAEDDRVLKDAIRQTAFDLIRELTTK